MLQVPSIQQSAALALGRLANYSDDLAEAVVGNEILPQLVYSLSEQNRFYKKAAAFVLSRVRYWDTLAGAGKCTVALRQNAIIYSSAAVYPVTNRLL